MTLLVFQPKNEVKGHKLWVYLSVDPDGTEGIVATPTNLGTMPLMTIDPQRIPQLDAIAREVRRLTGKKIVLAEFTRTDTKPL